MRAYADGETVLYRGAPVVLRHAPAPSGRPAVSLSADGTTLLISPADGPDRRQALLHWYTAETDVIIRGLLPAWAKKLAVRPRSASVKYAKTRWGSCSASGGLFFNSRLAMLSDPVAEYIVVHELCHLKQMNHSRAFWDLVESALPRCSALRRKLREEERQALL